MRNLLVDTDVFIDHIRGARKLNASRDELHYSVVTRCELFAGKNADEDSLRLLLSAFREIPVDSITAETAGRLRRAINIPTPDAIIAATALINNLVLFTRNYKDFKSVKRLKIASQEQT